MKKNGILHEKKPALEPSAGQAMKQCLDLPPKAVEHLKGTQDLTG